VPAAPSTIGPGPFVGAVAVTGYTCGDATCSKLSAGSTATVTVNYQISPTIQLVAPYVATAGAPNTVLIRGLGFRSFNVTGVRFGDTAAIEIAINQTGTELLATHPALTAGTYNVQLDATNHQGAIPSTVGLLVQDPVAYAATTLPLVPGTTNVRSLAYDAERSALLVVTDTAPSNPIARYAFANGAWGAPTQVTGGFVDAALSADGREIFGITASQLIRIDPVTLALGTVNTAQSLAENSGLKNIVVGNDTRAFVTTSLTTSGATQGYFFDPPSDTLAPNGTGLNNATPAMSAAGSGAIVVQGDPTLTADVPFYIYSSSNNSLTASAAAAQLQNSVPPAVDRSFSRFVVNGTRVYDGNQVFIGTLATTTQAVALSPNGTRAYAYDPTAGGIVVYDITADRDEAAYDPLGAVTPLTGNPGANVRMIIAPDGATLFLAGSAQIVVQPTPAQ
jgi:hypothetical protein